MKRFLPVLVLLVSAALAPAGTLDETARFLAGIHVQGSFLEPLTRDPAWLDHARALDSAWIKKDYHQVRPIRAWMLANAPEIYANASPVYYMFGGPDFLSATLFSPQPRPTSSRASSRSAPFPIFRGWISMRS